MHQKIDELIAYAKSSLVKDGLSEEYITNLSFTWKSFKQYLDQNNLILNRDTRQKFLLECYGIQSGNNYARLRPIDKRRRRAINVLFNCLENGNATRMKSYWPCLFAEPFQQTFHAFLDERKKRNFALATINRDIYSLNKFLEYLVLSDISSMSMITGKNVVGFIKWISADGKLPTTKNAASTLRLLLKYSHRESAILEDYSVHVPHVRVHKELPSVYTASEIDAMIGSFDRNSPIGVRNYAMVLMAVRFGIRASDICALKFSNINWDKNTIEFTTIKTGKHTVLPLTAETGNAIIRYLKEARPQTECKNIFIRLQRPFQQVSPPLVHTIVTKAFRDAGIVIPAGKRHGPHALRASLASEMLRNNTALPVISETLSHSCTDTTKVYLKVDFEHLRLLSLDVPHLDGVWMRGVVL